MQDKYCDNAVRSTGSAIVTPRCLNADAVKRVTIIYNEAERSTHNMCYDCSLRLKIDARSYGYKTEVEIIS